MDDYHTPQDGYQRQPYEQPYQQQNYSQNGYQQGYQQQNYQQGGYQQGYQPNGWQQQRFYAFRIVGERPQPSMVTAFKLFFCNYVNFEGRSRRSEYWKVVLMNFLIFVLLVVISVIGTQIAPNSSNDKFETIYILGLIIYYFVCLIPNISITVRRLHDVGISGAFALLLFAKLIPFINIFVMIADLILFCVDGKPEPNKWGPSPKYIIET